MNKFIKFGPHKIPTTNIHLVDLSGNTITVRYFNNDKTSATFFNPKMLNSTYKKLLNYRKNKK